MLQKPLHTPQLSDVLVLNVHVIPYLLSFLEGGAIGEVLQEERPHLLPETGVEARKEDRLQQMPPSASPQ